MRIKKETLTNVSLKGFLFFNVSSNGIQYVTGEIRTHDLRFRRPLLYPTEPL